MPFYLSIAFRNIFRDKRRSITLGINYFFISLLLLVLFSLTAGIKGNITDNVIASTAGHITISGEYIVKGRTFQGIKDYPEVLSVVNKLFPRARIFARYTLSSAVYHNGLSKRVSFRGIQTDLDRGLRDQISVDKASWDAFSGQPNAVIIPRLVAQYFGFKKDDEVLVSTRSRFGAFNTGTIQVRGVFSTANYFLRDAVISHFDFLQSLDLAEKTTASKMYIFFDGLRGVDAKRDLLLQKLSAAGFIAIKPASKEDAVNAVSAASPRYKVLDESVNQIRLTLATADEVTGLVSQVLGAVNGVGLFVAAIMLFIITISIFINMRMSINERMREIGTLRAIGAERGEVVSLFVAENIILCALFLCAGILFGLAVVGIVSHFITLPADGVLGLFLNNGHFVLKPTMLSILFIAAALVSSTALFSYFPARSGGKVPAVVALNKTT